ncbi:DUF294 nucleotidyltransferase-like domain-containing protein [Natranaerofaba carboxydovora]|uniref:DUF294 nucleotidyltransferase-like domain-containing protein n=1 Tax=Natranaerofaba carboxydovora TaxID=2742683 RepID=UPI001F1313B1|nr:DUF294 nucleotidyltransferase-like domain-containing protein [Natranaerofaba carboxydovora]UMZ74624.1 Hypoxic response protein 1 [Natranaerofaba carboxydovora]
MAFLKQETPKDYFGVLKDVSPFSFLDENTLNTALDKLHIRSYHEGSYVFRQGDQSKGLLFIVLSGKVEILVKGENGEEIKQGERTPYNFFGETAFFTDGRYAGSSKVIEEMNCLVIDEDTFEELADENPQFSQYFQKELGERIKNLYEKFLIEGSGGKDLSVDEASLRTSVKQNMISPVIVCKKDDTAKRVAEIMREHDVSSVVVVDDNEIPQGIITEQDLTHRIVANDISPQNVKAKDISSEHLITLDPEEYMYNALILMVKHKIKHIVVTEKEKLAGILTIRDLVKSRKAGALNIAASLENAKTIDDLLVARDEIDSLIDELIKERASAKMVCEVITEFYDQLTSKVIQISEKEMEAEGHGPPPVNYSFINMGSSGRKEQFMRTDQDNGIVFEDVYKLDEKEVQEYFLILGDKIVEGLVKLGFKRCPGDVMANNPKWCRSFKSWRNVVKKWATNPDGENVRLMTIFLDFRHIYGKKRYCDLLKNFVIRTFRESSVALQFLVRDDLRRKPPIGFFKQIKAQKDKKYGEWVNLKKSACVHIVDCLRVFSLREGIVSTNTYERLDMLKERNVLSKDDADFIHASYEALMMFRIKDSVDKVKQGLEPDNMVALNKLTKWEKTILRESLLAVERLQNLTGFAFYIYG